MKKQIVISAIIIFGLSYEYSTLHGEHDASINADTPARQWTLFSPALKRLGTRCKKAFIKISPDQLTKSPQKNIIIKPISEFSNKSPKFKIVNHPNGAQIIKGIAQNAEKNPMVREKIYQDCGSLIWGKQEHLILKLEDAQKISDHSALMTLQTILSEKYDNEKSPITRFGFEIYLERTLIEKDYEMLFNHQHLLTEEEYSQLKLYLEHYLSVLTQLDTIVNIIIMGHTIA